MSLSENPYENTALAPANGSRLDQLAKWLGVIGAGFCGLLIWAMVGGTVEYFTGRDPGGWGLGFLFILYIPLASIPVGLFCLVGAVLSAVALCRHPSPAARTGLWLSLVGPAVVIACYAAGFASLFWM